MTHLTSPTARQQGEKALLQLKDKRKPKNKGIISTVTQKYQPFMGPNSSVYTCQQLLQQAQNFQQQSSRSARSNKRNKKRGSNHRRLAGGQSEGDHKTQTISERQPSYRTLLPEL